VVLVGGVLVDDGQCAVAAGGEDVAGGGIEAGSVDAFADGDGSDDLAGSSVGNGENAAAAAGEEAVVGGVDGERRGLLAGGGGPAAEDGSFAGVDFDDFVLVGDVGVDFAVAGGDGVLGLAAEGDVGDGLSGGRVNDGGGCGVAVHGEDAVGRGVVEGGVGVFLGWGTANDLEGLEVEHGDGLVLRGGGEAVGWSDGGAMGAVDVGYLADELAGVFVDDHEVRAAGDEDVVRGGVGDDVVPAAFAAEDAGVGDLVGTVGLREERGAGEKDGRAGSEEHGERRGSHGSDDT